MRLSNKVALITGAAQGLGAEIARKFHEEGAFVFLGDVNGAAGERTARLLKGAVFLRLEVVSEESWKQAFAAILAKMGRLDILVNNAGIKHALPILRASGGGTILNMSSICGLVGHRYTNEAYTATKGALTLLTKSVATRYAKDNIRCVSIHPSTVNTPLLEAVLKDPERRAERFNEIPLGRLATVRDVANVFVFLASDEAAFINGAAIAVDGGLTAY